MHIYIRSVSAEPIQTPPQTAKYLDFTRITRRIISMISITKIQSIFKHMFVIIVANFGHKNEKVPTIRHQI